MGKEFDQIDSSIRTWIEKQKLFFVATAPSSADGLVNLSPKGMDSFRVLGPNTIAYLDLTGSGIETIAHLKDNPRITVMMCAFEGPPKIFRFYGRGEAFLAGSDRYKELLPKFGQLPGARSIIHIELDRIIDSCGYSIRRKRRTRRARLPAGKKPHQPRRPRRDALVRRRQPVAATGSRSEAPLIWSSLRRRRRRMIRLQIR